MLPVIKSSGLPWVSTKKVIRKIEITFWLLGAFRRASDMFQMWFVLCSGIIFGANTKSMLTVDHFARDEHVLKTGKSACVRMDAWKVHHSLGTTNDTRTTCSPSVKHNFLLINTNKPSGCCQLCFVLLWGMTLAVYARVLRMMFLNQTDEIRTDSV